MKIEESSMSMKSLIEAENETAKETRRIEKIHDIEENFWHDASDIPDLDTSRAAVRRAIEYTIEYELGPPNLRC